MRYCMNIKADNNKRKSPTTQDVRQPGKKLHKSENAKGSQWIINETTRAFLVVIIPCPFTLEYLTLHYRKKWTEM